MHSNKVLFKYLFFDILATLIVWLLFVVFRKMINDIQIIDNFGILLPSRYYLFSLIFFPFYCVFIYYLIGFYIRPLRKQKINLFLSTLFSSTFISITVFFVLKLGDVVISVEYFYYSLFVLFLQLFFVTYVFRRIIFAQVERNFKTKRWSINTIIIGVGSNAQRIAADIEAFAKQHTFVGYVSVNRRASKNSDRLIGSLFDVESVINKYNVQEIIVALENDAHDKELFRIINLLYKFNVEIRFTPRLYEILTGSVHIGTFGLSPLVSITQINMPDWQISVKRVVDFLFALIALILLSPIFLYISIRIRRESDGPAFYLQERIGLYGKPFKIIKFRTMYEDSENGIPQLSSALDNRITPFGRILRKYRIDEFPQFLNVLKGDMSLVGPRPERQYYINEIIKDAPYYCLLYKIRPGLTSWGPIKIGYSDTLEKMIERLNFDIIYIENMSLLNDIKILLLTIDIVFKGKGV